MRKTLLRWAGLTLVTLLLWGCSAGSGNLIVRREIAAGDRQKDWALVYYRSWRHRKDQSYLQLAHDEMARSVDTYYRLQLRMGHSYPDFYIADKKRLRSCNFLREMAREALKYRVELPTDETEGCPSPTGA